MPRPKRPPVFTVLVGPSDDARTELKTGIERLLAMGNLFLKGADALARVAHESSQAQAENNPTITATERAELEATILKDLTSFTAAAHQALTLISEGRSFRFGNWPEWTKSPLASIISLTESGAVYLRRCHACELWMTVQDKRRWLCNRVACKRAVDAKRRRVDRRREFDAQHRACVQIKGTSGTK
jgi:hypothetical protein